MAKPFKKLKALQRELAEAKRLYEAAKSSQYHRIVSSSRSPDGVMDQARGKIRDWARYLDENHDLAIGILDELVNKVIGTGLVIEPMVRRTSGQLAEDVNAQIRRLWDQWNRRPETTGEIPGAEVDRLLCRTWLRDGEVLQQHIEAGRIQHLSPVPYSIELIEPDYLPFDLFGDKPRIVHGVEKDGWGRPVAYHLYKEHPGNLLFAAIGLNMETVRIPRERIVHLKFTRRLRQTRGVSVLHGIVNRLDDIKDYEESERIAARVAAAFTAYVKRNPDMIGESAASTDRTLEMNPGMIIDDLLPGEEIGTLGTERPNTNLQQFRNSQLRAAACGTGTSYSSISRDFNGTYSAQRQEMVEASPAYGRLRTYFIEAAKRPTYERFLAMAIAAGLVQVKRGIDRNTLTDVDIRGPGLPWIDPKKEIEADGLAIEYGLKSRQQVIRERGGNPAQVDAEREADTFERRVKTPQATDGQGMGGQGMGEEDSEDDQPEEAAA